MKVIVRGLYPPDSSEDESEIAELLIISMNCEYNRNFLNKVPVRTFALTGREFICELLQGSGTVIMNFCE